MKTRTLEIPGYVAGTWQIDPVHSDVSFTVRHMMVSKVRGRFDLVSGTIHLADDPLESSLAAEIDMASIDTGNADRDDHLRSAEYFDVEQFPTMHYRSTAVEQLNGDLCVIGDLLLRGTTCPVVLHVEPNGFATDPTGVTRAGFSATTSINRKDFGITMDMPMDGGGVVVGDKINIHLEIEAIRSSS
jgi:polyisoprenoid-binding protein YceI